MLKHSVKIFDKYQGRLVIPTLYHYSDDRNVAPNNTNDFCIR